MAAFFSQTLQKASATVAPEAVEAIREKVQRLGGFQDDADIPRRTQTLSMVNRSQVRLPMEHRVVF
jgi:hypothetical protein